ncbi:hypothetical protein CONPUDRAFT_74403 [Coniophora puteana RWD-64-598 SS2]|uniref:Uncharacterized protein n=1 Tax=Coniophora puteana (strain RWD-64-598) TaxID=741705 RepID=A0A5M3MHX0_CONPW|nr:uncharacterized protein CONPUDRAFT_74403 [Coniophora puteana RWD-64-598 SS2]EIW78802.1 hypothetical protein CONPUDRAFT_74403 [Coniophora puteana RWD-64-598 SS2]
MSSASLQQELDSEVSLFIIGAYANVVYDYCGHFPAVFTDFNNYPQLQILIMSNWLLNMHHKVEFIWNQARKISWTTIVYAVFRCDTWEYHSQVSLFHSSYFAWVLFQVLSILLSITLQGMMAVRVYGLLGRSRAVLIGLSTCFTTTSIINITGVAFYMATGPDLVFQLLQFQHPINSLVDISSNKYGSFGV